MKKSIFLCTVAAALLLAVGCGPSAAEQEKAKQEILAIEANEQKVDSVDKEVAKTASELDALLNQLNAK